MIIIYLFFVLFIWFGHDFIPSNEDFSSNTCVNEIVTNACVRLTWRTTCCGIPRPSANRVWAVEWFSVEVSFVLLPWSRRACCFPICASAWKKKWKHKTKTPRFSKYNRIWKMENRGNRHLPVHRALDDGVVQRAPYVSGVLARQQPTVNIGRE